MQIPSQLIAGDNASWQDLPFVDGLGQAVDSVAYTLTYSFRGQATGAIDLVGTPTGTGWQFALTAAQSAALNTTAASLLWYWQAFASKAGPTRVTAGSGTLVVRPNVAALSTSAAFDGRSQAAKDLAAVQAEIASRISGGATLEYTIGTRSLKKEPMSALVLIEQRCMRIVSRERRMENIKNGLGNPGRVGVRFR